MFKIHRLLLTLLVLSGLLFIQACGRYMPKEQSCHFVMNSNGQRVSWKSKEDIKVYVHNSVPVHFESAIEEAVATWNTTLSEHKIILQMGINSQNTPGRDGYSVIYLLHDWERDRSTEQARTTVYWSGNRIYEADIRLNADDFDFFVDDDPDTSKVHLQSLMIHELGHLIGLAHNGEEGSVMNASLNNGTFRDEIKDPDMESLQCEYL